MIQKMRFMGMDPEDVAGPGAELLVLEGDLVPATPPREYEIVMVNGVKMQVVEQGVLWNFNQHGCFVTVAVTAVESGDDEG